MSFPANGRLEGALERLAEAAAGVVRGAELRDALQAVAEASAAATGAELAVVRVLDPADGKLVAAAVASSSRARAAEIEGTRFPLAEFPATEVADVGSLPPAVRRIAERTRSEAVLQLPVVFGEEPVGTLELLRAAGSFDPVEILLARLAASQVALCLHAFENGRSGSARPSPEQLDLTAEALATGASPEADPERLLRLAAGAWQADAAVLWRVAEGALPDLLAEHGLDGPATRSRARELVRTGLASGDPLVVERGAARLPEGCSASAVVPLGKPPAGALQLLFGAGRAPGEENLSRLTAFGAQAAGALRAGERSRALSLELERSRALLGVLGQATAELSLAHTLATAVERIRSLLSVERVAVYLMEGDSLVAAAADGLAGPHPVLAARLLDITLGPPRVGGVLVVEDARTDRRLASAARAAEETGIESALAVPLVANEDVVGLVAAYPPAGSRPDEQELALLGALARQLGVAVQNARLHEQAKALGLRLERALAAESAERRRLDGLYEVSRSFVQSLSLEATLDAVARAAVESLGVGAAILRVPDPRGEALVMQAVHVADQRLEDALRAMLSEAQVVSRSALQRLFRRGEPVRLDRFRARELGGSFALLVPFLEKGSTAVIVPVATPAEVIATLNLISLDPAEPIGDATVDAALSLASLAALAIENASLYQQQKQFYDTMQRSLLPRDRPDVPGVELGVVYQSSARMDVGGDVYDFMQLDDGRLAVVVGDVTGHGIDAAADMAMAKFVFRSLAREHPDPGDFLSHANDVVAGEIALGKFITLLYLTLDSASWEVACAAAGHPAPAIVQPDGTIDRLDARGLALGIEPDQPYVEVRRALPPGAAVVLYTDGVIEERRNGELYGTERLEAFVAANRHLPAQRLAEALVDDCRRFGKGELVDDCAVVVIRRRA